MKKKNCRFAFCRKFSAIYKNSLYALCGLLVLSAFGLMAVIDPIGVLTNSSANVLVADNSSYCTPDSELDWVEYDHFGGYPNQCDCHGNCWDEYGCWYDDWDYTGSDATWGYPGSVDCAGNRWNNYGLWEEDFFYPYDFDDVGWDYNPDDIIGDGGGYYLEDQPFWDVDASNEYYYSVLHVFNQGIFTGYADGSFGPYGLINRAEFLKVLVENAGHSPSAGGNTNCFTDVHSEWYAPYVCFAKSRGWVGGYSDGTFKPAQTVNLAEALKMFLEVQNAPVDNCMYGAAMDVVADDWHCKYFQFAAEYGLVDKSDLGDYGLGYFYPELPMFRGDVADLFYRYDILYLGMQ